MAEEECNCFGITLVITLNDLVVAYNFDIKHIFTRHFLIKKLKNHCLQRSNIWVPKQSQIKKKYGIVNQELQLVTIARYALYSQAVAVPH